MQLPQYRRLRGNTAAREAGLRFEAKVQERLCEEWLGYWPSPTLDFSDDLGRRRCIPDGVLARSEAHTVFEIKVQHVPEAWWQLKRLYEPVVRAWCPKIPVRLVEIVRSYDAAMPFPVNVSLAGDLSEVVSLPPDKFVVLIWSK